MCLRSVLAAGSSSWSSKQSTGSFLGRTGKVNVVGKSAASSFELSLVGSETGGAFWDFARVKGNQEGNEFLVCLPSGNDRTVICAMAITYSFVERFGDGLAGSTQVKFFASSLLPVPFQRATFG